MRNKYSKEFEIWVCENAPKYSLNELVGKAKRFGININKSKLIQYLSKRKIRTKNYNAKMVRNMGDKVPIGTEYIKPDGMKLVKVAKDKWEYKQRLVYQEHYGNIKRDEMIIFLDGNKNNFDIKNLMSVKTREYNLIRNKHLVCDDTETMRTAILSARLWYKGKNYEKNR